MALIDINNDKLKEFLTMFIRKLEKGRKTLDIVTEDNINKIVNEYQDIIDEEIEIKQNKYWVFLDFNSFPYAQSEYKEALKDLSKFIENNWQAIFWQKIKNYGFFMWKIYFLFNDIFNYTTFRHFNQQLDWNQLIYWIDLQSTELFVKREDEVKHNAVFAITRSGKTVWLQNILYSTMDRQIYKQYPNLRPEAVIIEKSMDFDDVVVFKWITYKGSLEWNDVISFKDILQMFFYVDLQYRYRKWLFKEAGTQKIQDYNNVADPDKRIGLLFVVIDEFQSVLKKFEWNSNTYKFLVSRIAKVTAVYTDSWIYLYAWTQLYGSEKGIPSNIAGNIETRLFGRYITEWDLYTSTIKDTYITTQNISKWDLLWTQGTDVKLMRSPLPYSLDILGQIEDAKERNDTELLKKLNVLKFKEVHKTLSNFELKDWIETDDDIQNTIFDANTYMKWFLTEKIEVLLTKLWDKDIKRWFNREFLEEYGIDVREISWMERFSFVVLANILKTYVEETKETVESWQFPIEFDFEQYKERTIDSAEIVSYPIILSDWIWKQYFSKLWKVNIDRNVIKQIEKILNEKSMWWGDEAEMQWKMKFVNMLLKVLKQKKQLQIEDIQKIGKMWMEEAWKIQEILQNNNIIDEMWWLIDLPQNEDEIADLAMSIEMKPQELQLLDSLDDKVIQIFQLAFKKFIRDRN